MTDTLDLLAAAFAFVDYRKEDGKATAAAIDAFVDTKVRAILAEQRPIIVEAERPPFKLEPSPEPATTEGELIWRERALTAERGREEYRAIVAELAALRAPTPEMIEAALAWVETWDCNSPLTKEDDDRLIREFVTGILEAACKGRDWRSSSPA